VYKRRKILINRKIQFVYLGLSLIPMLVLSGTIYYLIYITIIHHIAIPEIIINNILKPFSTVNILLLIALPIVIAVVTYRALITSHRVAGPLYRIEQDLKQMAKTGDFSRQIKIRQKDQLQGLTTKVNNLLSKLKTSQD